MIQAALDSFARRGFFVFKARGTSMLPSIPDGSLVHVYPVQRSITAGDVVLAHYRNDEWLCHRVIRVSRGGLVLTKGDFNRCMDEPISRWDVVGRVEYVVTPWGSWRSLNRPPWRTLGKALSWVAKISPSGGHTMAWLVWQSLKVSAKLRYRLHAG